MSQNREFLFSGTNGTKLCSRNLAQDENSHETLSRSEENNREIYDSDLVLSLRTKKVTLPWASLSRVSFCV